VVPDAAVDGGVHLVQHDEEQVETGEERVGQADVLGGAQVVVVLREQEGEGQSGEQEKSCRRNRETERKVHITFQSSWWGSGCGRPAGKGMCKTYGQEAGNESQEGREGRRSIVLLIFCIEAQIVGVLQEREKNKQSQESRERISGKESQETL
jgi:hypothetical protein